MAQLCYAGRERLSVGELEFVPSMMSRRGVPSDRQQRWLENIHTLVAEPLRPPASSSWSIATCCGMAAALSWLPMGRTLAQSNPISDTDRSNPQYGACSIQEFLEGLARLFNALLGGPLCAVERKSYAQCEFFRF